MKRVFAGVLAVLLAATVARAEPALRLSTTTSTEASGLLTYLLPYFEKSSGIKVDVIAVGTGKALALAKNGDVDVTLVHARALEDKFVADGDGIDRRDVMYNDFVLAGPLKDPAGVKGGKDVVAAFRQIAGSGASFISRGDGSGTEVMEQRYWQLAGTRPPTAHYLAAGQGMGEVLNMAAQLQAYTLSDRATFSTYKAKTGLAVLVEGDARMANPYGIIAVNPARHKGINYPGARKLIEWITAADGQRLIAQFRPDGEQLFFPGRR
ncbi:MAG: substrate-binding domain-containing protein [Massilia sp.]